MSSKGLLLLLLIGLAGAAVTFAVFRGDDSNGAEASIASGAEETNEDDGGSDSDVLASPSTDSKRTIDEVEGEGGDEPDVVQGSPQEGDEAEDRIRVRVLSFDGSTAPGMPVGVYFAPAGAPSAMPIALVMTGADGVGRFLELEFEPEDLPVDGVLSVGVDLPLDPEVRRELTRPEVASAFAGEVLELRLPEGAEQLAGPLRVQVVDAAGEPAVGVEVGYRLQLRGDPEQGDDIEWVETMAPDGIAEIDRTKEARVRTYLEGMRQPFERAVSCRGAFIDPASKMLAEGDLGKLVRLQLEPTGSLEIEVVGTDGERIMEGASVQFSWTKPGETQRESFKWLKVEDGTARVQHVACGMKIGLGASLRDSLFKGLQVDVPGPVEQGDVVSVTLRFEEQHPVLAGRLLAPDGTPLVGQRFSLELDYSEPRRSQSDPFQFRGSYHGTGAEGRFELPWSAAGWQEEERSGVRVLRIIERAPQSGAPPGWSPRFAVVDAPRFVEGETRYELGDVTLDEMPLLVSGQVVDESGQPVSSAFVQVTYAVGEGDRTKWYNHGDRPYSDQDGRFLLRTSHPYERIRVSAWKTRGGSSDNVDAEVGESGVRLVFVPDDPEESRGTLVGTILADDSIPWAGLSLRLRATGPTKGSGYRDSTPFAGSYRITRVMPGTYRLEIVSDGHGYDGPNFELHTEEDIQIRAGEETVVPSIDLRGELRLFELTVLDPDGERVDRVSCTVGNERVRHAGGWVKGGRLAFVAPSDLDSVELAVGNFLPVVVLWSPDPKTIRLQK